MWGGQHWDAPITPTFPRTFPAAELQERERFPAAAPLDRQVHHLGGGSFAALKAAAQGSCCGAEGSVLTELCLLQRLAIAKEFGDKAAERRAYSNLGNAHIFLGRFDISAEYYK